MSHFAKVVDGKVTKVIVAEKEFFDTYEDFDLPKGEWIQTSYNTRNGIHYGQDGKPDGGIALRGNYAGIGFTYNKEDDIFYPMQPYPSWVLNKNILDWEAPVPMPNDDKQYIWDENTISWIEVLKTI